MIGGFSSSDSWSSFSNDTDIGDIVDDLRTGFTKQTFHHHQVTYTLWLFNIALENGSFIDGWPIKNGDFPWLC
jgi:hypothetical protein